jgi:uroporphyrin-III C-methyltransferase/precorrin-2 dehydrogenase/sirohydrochlorin ferrochelatase
MKFLPVFLKLEDKTCLVVGGGEVAYRKIQSLAGTHARINVVARALCPEVEALVEQGELIKLASEYDPAQLDSCDLVIAATNDEELNRRISSDAHDRHIPVNVVDNPGLCSFIMPSVVDRNPVQIAISTGGASPVLARLLRARLETLVPSAYGKLAELMKSVREEVKQKLPVQRERRHFWESVLQGPIAELLLSGQEDKAISLLHQHLEDPAKHISQQGEVYLVGGGPGDPDLLTFRALRLMQQSDVVLYDRLVAPAIVALARKDADRIYVGKQSDQHAMSQDEINELLVKLANEGKRVLRLKGGDPFIFGRGGEEIDKLAEAGIPFQVVPGITAASGCASYAGIPLTHRDYAQSCVFITGHLKDGKLDLNWQALVQPGQTIAVYMGVGAVRVLCESLINNGMNATTPVAIIQQGTTIDQRTYTGLLSNIADLVEQQDIKPPSMMIIGDVVKLRDKLAWFKEPGDN